MISLPDSMESYFDFVPRPDQPERYDQQTAFYESQTHGVSWLIGGNGAGCLGAEQEVYDPVLNLSRRVDSIESDFHVWSRDRYGERVIAQASRPKIYGVENLYRIMLSNGRCIHVTMGHRVLDCFGEWRPISDFVRYEDEIISSCGGTLSIYSVEFLRKDCYWDFSVKEHENYWMEGVYHHNTSEVACAKLAKFVFETPPPRWDTPFWVISNSYPNVMESLWKEKLYGHGHIPYDAVDWPRVEWYKPNQGWPFRVPLKPHPGSPGRNWVIEHKSYEQGRQKMQARSIGGFMFSEQFPWGLLEEVLRGCREYDFPGSKFCEFTPIDPNLSVEIEEMIEEDKLPPGWEVFRANTECALEAGHVKESWFQQFFGMVSDEMRETRMTGQFATYEGAVYKGFNPAVHLVGDEVIIHPPNVFYRRGIDWGAGPDNAFCALLAYVNGLGQWYVFDEYYSTDQECTTVDHLCNVQELWPWPQNNPHYGVSWADPSSPDNIRLAQNIEKYCPRDKDGEPIYSPMSIQRGRNAVIEGIEHIQYLLKPSIKNMITGKLEPRLFIHKENCPNLSRQMRTYRWLKPSEAGLNPQNPRKEPVKKNDHSVDALRYVLFSEAVHSGNTPSSMAKQRRTNERGVHLQGVR